MGYRPRPAPTERAHGACLPGHRHDGVPVEAAGEVVAHVCRHCLVKLVGHGRLSGGQPAAWFPYSDDGHPLPTLPDPGRR